MKRKNILETLEFSDENVVVCELFETPYAKEVGIAMQAHQVLCDHASLYPVTLEVLEGLVQFSAADDGYVLERGDIVTLDAGVKHDLEAIENTLIRLTLFVACEIEK